MGEERGDAELKGQHVILLLLAAAYCLPCFPIPPYVHSQSNIPKDPKEALVRLFWIISMDSVYNLALIPG